MADNNKSYIKSLLRELGQSVEQPHGIAVVLDNYTGSGAVSRSPKQIIEDAIKYIEKLETDVDNLSRVQRILDAAEILSSDNNKVKFSIVYEHIIDNVVYTSTATIYAINIDEALTKLKEADTAFCSIKSYQIEG